MNIQNFFDSKFEQHDIPKSDSNWEIGRIEDISFDSINNFGKSAIHNGKVFITYSISILDAYMSSVVSENIKSALNQNSNKSFLIGTNSLVNVCNTFGGGYIQTKIPDAKIYGYRDACCKPIVVKCAFSNESLSLLVEECVIYLNEFTHNSYSIGFKVNYDSENFKGFFFVLERLESPDEKRIKLMNYLIHKNVFKIYGNYCQIELEEFEKALKSNQMNRFNVKIVYMKEINDKNFYETITFYLKREKIDPEASGLVEVIIEKDDLAHIFNLWKRKFLK